LIFLSQGVICRSFRYNKLDFEIVQFPSLLGGIPKTRCHISHIDNHLLLPIIHISVFLCEALRYSPQRLHALIQKIYCLIYLGQSLLLDSECVKGSRLAHLYLSTIGLVPHDRYHPTDYLCVFV
jgi:hypothetical protein